MDKRLILAVAGSGKTYHIIEKLDEHKRFLIITYTVNNAENLRNAVIKKFGYIPSKIKIQTYFKFLYSFCFKPFLSNEINAKGICWEQPTNRYTKLSESNFYILNEKWLYHNRIAKLIIEKKIVSDVNLRLAKYYDHLFIDEVQDFGGHDFNLLCEISKSKLEMLLVGDFFQHTFSTSNDGKVNTNLYENPIDYLKRFEKLKFTVDSTTLVSSRRCSKTTCDFIRDKIGIEISSYRNTESECKLITDECEAEKIYNDKNIVKLFYQENYKFDCFSDNWGSCKGLEFENVCVVVSDEILKKFSNNTLASLKPTTKNKFYVACSRAKSNLYFVPIKFYSKYKKGKNTSK